MYEKNSSKVKASLRSSYENMFLPYALNIEFVLLLPITLNTIKKVSSLNKSAALLCFDNFHVYDFWFNQIVVQTSLADFERSSAIIVSWMGIFLLPKISRKTFMRRTLQPKYSIPITKYSISLTKVSWFA